MQRPLRWLCALKRSLPRAPCLVLGASLSLSHLLQKKVPTETAQCSAGDSLQIQICNCCDLIPSHQHGNAPQSPSFPPGLHGDNWGSLYKLNTRALPPKPHCLGRTSLTSTARGSKTTPHNETSGSHSTLSSDLQFKTLDSNSSSATHLLPRGFITAFLPTR